MLTMNVIDCSIFYIFTTTEHMETITFPFLLAHALVYFKYGGVLEQKESKNSDETVAN